MFDAVDSTDVMGPASDPAVPESACDGAGDDNCADCDGCVDDVVTPVLVLATDVCVDDILDVDCVDAAAPACAVPALCSTIPAVTAAANSVIFS